MYTQKICTQDSQQIKKLLGYYEKLVIDCSTICDQNKAKQIDIHFEEVGSNFHLG